MLQFLNPLFIKNGWELPAKEWGLKLAELIGPSLTLINDGVEESRIFFETPSLKEDGIEQLRKKGSKEAINLIVGDLETRRWDGKDKEHAMQLINNSAKKLDFKKGLKMKSLRASLLGTLQGPDLLTSWSLLAMNGSDLERMKKSLEIK